MRVATKVFPSLQRALIDFGIPTENHALVTRMCEAIAISRFEEYSNHIRAIRSDGRGNDLHIHWGWTDGFTSEAEALMATQGRAPHVQSDMRGQGFYYVEHPVNRLHDGGAGTKSTQRDYGTCPRCFLSLPAVGACDNCD